MDRPSCCTQSGNSFRIPRVAEILVALRSEDMEWFGELLRQAALPTPIRLVEGGDTRQESVENALAALDPDTDLVAVHDAVRPFIDRPTIEKVIEEAADTGAAIVGIVPVDTVKQVRKNKIHGTLPRERLTLAQTPQVFRYGLLKEAFERRARTVSSARTNPAWWSGWSRSRFR